MNLVKSLQTWATFMEGLKLPRRGPMKQSSVCHGIQAIPSKISSTASKSVVTAIEALPPYTSKHMIDKSLMAVQATGLFETAQNPTYDSTIIKKTQYTCDFGVVHAPQLVNAFASPGGIIRVMDILLKRLSLTDVELTVLIGHELSQDGRPRPPYSPHPKTHNMGGTIYVEDHFDGYTMHHVAKPMAERLWKSVSYLEGLA